MLKMILSLIIFSSFAFAITKNQVYSLYKNKDYKNVCKKGAWIFTKNKNDETYLSIVALSCIKADMLNSALGMSKYMNNKRKIGRVNASYIANLYLIKRLLIQFVYDGIDLSNLSLPKSNHFLSKVFENLSKHNYMKENNKFVIKLKNITYILQPLEDSKAKKIIITVIKNNKIYNHIFW
jgi:hypothetical protein